MTATLIKSGTPPEQFAVREYDVPKSVPAAPIIKQDGERERLVRRVSALEGELRERERAIVTLRAQTAEVVASAREEGRAAGLQEAVDRQEARVAVLEQSLRRAEKNACDALATMERLSARLAEGCLDVMVGEHQSRAEWVAQLIRHQVTKIDKAMILQVVVSQDDFPDADVLQRLAERAKVPLTTVTSDRDLPSGNCQMKLRLGRLEIGINQQWGALRDVLDEMAQSEAAS